MKISKEFDNTSTASWVYDQQKRQEKKQAKQMRSMRQGKRDTWSSAE